MKRPSLPMWSHHTNEWVYNGVGYSEDQGSHADHQYNIDMSRYATYLEGLIQDNELLEVIALRAVFHRMAEPQRLFEFSKLLDSRVAYLEQRGGKLWRS